MNVYVMLFYNLLNLASSLMSAVTSLCLAVGSDELSLAAFSVLFEGESLLVPTNQDIGKTFHE